MVGASAGMQQQGMGMQPQQGAMGGMPMGAMGMPGLSPSSSMNLPSAGVEELCVAMTISYSTTPACCWSEVSHLCYAQGWR